MTEDATRAVWFDLDGTLLSLPGDYAAAVHAATASVLGVRDGAFAETYSERFLELLGAVEPAPYRRAFEHAIETHDVDNAAGDAEALVAALREAEVDATEPPEGAVEALEALRERGERVGVLTNGVPGFQRAKLEAHGLDALVDAVAVSYEAGAHKPDERAFALAAKRLPAAEYVMVGDSHEADVEGARAMGWRGVHYAPDGESPEGDDALASFGALPERLD